MKQVFSTRLTELLRIDHPLIVGGMMYLSDASLVAAVVKAGAMGFITARSFATAEDFRKELRKCKKLCADRPFGVNLTLSKRWGFDVTIASLLQVALDEGVRLFESAGVLPEELIAPIHQARGILIHKCPRIRHALAAERLGVDAVILVGRDEGGHPGANDLSSFVQAAFAVDRLQVPLIVGGGIGHGRQIAAALALGADGVALGSRFTAAVEVSAHDNYKRAVVDADEDCSMTALEQLGETWRVLKNDDAREVKRIEASGAASFEVFGDLIRGYRTKEFCYDQGEIQKGMISLGPAAGFVDRIEPVASIVARLMRDAEASLSLAAMARAAVLARNSSTAILGSP